MRQATGSRKSSGEKIVKDIKRVTCKQYSSEDKIRGVLDGLRGEDRIAELCRPLPGGVIAAQYPDRY
jgi:transposase